MWVKIDDGFATHPKILAAGPIAAIIQIRAICFASQNQTDGFIHQSAVPILLTGLEQIGIDEGRVGDYATMGCQANEIDWPAYMLEHRLWDQGTNGYHIHDYLEWNLSKSDIENVKKQRAKAGKKGMKSRYSKGNSTLTDVITPVITPVITNDITKPYHAISTSISTSSLSSSSLGDFESFWQSYPKKVGKKAALAAWNKAQDKPPIAEIVAAIQRAKQSDQWMKDGGQYIPNPSTWLNQGRWADQPLTNGTTGNGHAAIPPFPGPEDPIGRNLWRQTYGDPASPRRLRTL